MSLTKKDRKIRPRIGRTIPEDCARDVGGSFERMIANALHRAYGDTHAAIKTVAGQAQANERAVKNWFMAKNGPSGRHLVDLIRISDEILEAVLIQAERQELVVTKKLTDSKRVLIKMFELIDELWHTTETAEAGHQHGSVKCPSLTVGCSYRKQVQ